MRRLALTLLLAAAPVSGLLAQDTPPPAPPPASEASPPTPPPPKTVSEVTFTPAAGWLEEPCSGMRAAQYRLRKAEGDAEDAILVVYFFGGGQGGSVEDNITRWCGQFQRPDGKPAREAARVEKRDVNGNQVHEVEVDGTFVAETRPGSGERVRKEGQRMLGAIVVTPKAGSFFVKLVGPDKTVQAAKDDFKKFCDSFKQG